jgi:hypothetical protein
MRKDRFTIPGLEGRLVLTFVPSISAAARLAEVDCVRGRELERERALVRLEIADPKNRTSQPVRRSSYRRVDLHLMHVQSV